MLLSASLYAQSVPQGMKYQAVARDLSGNVIANQTIGLKISLLSNGKGSTVYYNEVHSVTTSSLGLFTLVIGEGKVDKGTFASVPWSNEDIWMQVSIKDDKSSSFTAISNSQLLAVPYAFHAATASQLVAGKQNEVAGSAAPTDLVPAQVWSLKGNSRTSPLTDRLGTTDAADLVIITNNIERLRITSGGNINLKNSLDVNVDLTVRKNAYLNTEGGQTISNGPLTVSKESATLLTGKLQVNKDVLLKEKLLLDNVTYNSSSPTNGVLVVAGGAGIGKNLNVGGNLDVAGTTKLGGATTFGSKATFTDSASSISTTTGALVIAGGVGISKQLNVGGVTTIENTLNVKKNDSSFVAYFGNSNGGDGDGIEIKLGKTHPAYTGSAYLNITNVAVEAFQMPITTIRGWIIDQKKFEPVDLIKLFPATLVAGTACNLINLITENLNKSIPLPVRIPNIHILDETEIVPKISFGALGSIPAAVIPALDIPGFELIPKIPAIDCSMLPSFSTPVIDFNNVSNSLTNENQFISFKDNDGRELGSIRAQSVLDWSANYLDGAYFVNLMAGMAGIDLVGALAGAVSGFTDITESYNEIGVEYASGHADYAEWLERANHSELISAGHIVGVKGGKISKDLTGAEQIMVISTNPMILGNTPPAGQEVNGQKVAFMGQVPVNVIGAVKIGDFIVADKDGYGKAVDPSAITAKQLKLTIGRTLQANSGTGVNKVNTLIGIDKADLSLVIESMETRVTSLEEKLDQILNGFKAYGEEVKALNEKNNKHVQDQKEKIRKDIEERHKKEMDERRENNKKQ
jgi:hypothetical protein